MTSAAAVPASVGIPVTHRRTARSIEVITAHTAEENPDLSFVLPQEGSEQFTDCWAVPASASNKKNGELWINFMLKKSSAEKNYEYLTYSIPNKAVYDYVSDDENAMNVLFPEASVLEKCEALKNLGSEADDMYSVQWKRFKS